MPLNKRNQTKPNVLRFLENKAISSLIYIYIISWFKVTVLFNDIHLFTVIWFQVTNNNNP